VQHQLGCERIPYTGCHALLMTSFVVTYIYEHHLCCVKFYQIILLIHGMFKRNYFVNTVDKHVMQFVVTGGIPQAINWGQIAVKTLKAGTTTAIKTYQKQQA
jgi:hypothetical protein